jgi:formylglycine-generating enzyme required for sulfatase activity
MKTKLFLLFFLCTVFHGYCDTDKFVQITSGEILKKSDGRSVAVKIPDLFWSVNKVSISDWKAYCAKEYKDFDYHAVLADGTLNDKNIETGNYPIVFVTWLEVIKYCNWLSIDQKRKPVYVISKDVPFSSKYYDNQLLPDIIIDHEADGYRLPTSDEWEYASKGGNQGLKIKWWIKADLLEFGYFIENANGKLQPQGTKNKYSSGLFDIIGNTREWCEDNVLSDLVYDEDTIDENGKAVKKGTPLGLIWKVTRGASMQNSVYHYPYREYSGKIQIDKEKPNYFEKVVPTDPFSRELVGFRIVTIRAPNR